MRPARLERATSWFVARRSIQLSYGRGGDSQAEARSTGPHQRRVRNFDPNTWKLTSRRGSGDRTSEAVAQRKHTGERNRQLAAYRNLAGDRTDGGELRVIGEIVGQ